MNAEEAVAALVTITVAVITFVVGPSVKEWAMAKFGGKSPEQPKPMPVKREDDGSPAFMAMLQSVYKQVETLEEKVQTLEGQVAESRLDLALTAEWAVNVEAWGWRMARFAPEEYRENPPRRPKSLRSEGEQP